MHDILKNPLQSVIVIGAGRMGLGIAYWMMRQKRRVTIIESTPTVAAETTEKIRDYMTRLVTRGLFSQNEVEGILQQSDVVFDYSNLPKADLVIECVPEDWGMKRSVYENLNAVVDENTIICSNTSSLEISRMAEFVDAPGRFMGTHFFYPITRNPVVELVRGNKTDPGLLRLLRKFFIQHGKTPIPTKDSPGFIVNRFFVPYISTAYWLMKTLQLSAATIDEVALKLFGSMQGPIEISTWIGLKHAARDMENLSKLGHFYTITPELRFHAQNNESVRLGDTQPITDAQEECIRSTLMGCVFFVILQILDEGVGTAEDVDRAAQLALRFSNLPCAMMDEMGKEAVIAYITPILELHGDGMPSSIEDVGSLTAA